MMPKMGTAEKQNIAVQHALWNKHKKSAFVTCEEWRDARFKQMRAKGIKIIPGVLGKQLAFKIINGENVKIVPQDEIQHDYDRACARKMGVKP